MDPAVELAIDGFPLDPNDPDIRYHRELSAWLELDQTPRVPVPLQFDASSQNPHWLRPAVRRFAWVRTHAALIAGDRKLDSRLAHLISHLLNRIYKPESDAIEETTFAELALQAPAIDASGAGSMFRADTARLLLELAKTGIGPATRQSVHTMLRGLAPEDRFGGMHELAWHLFVTAEDSEAGEPSSTAQVHRDLQGMKPALRKPWLSLLKLAPIRKATDAKWEQKIREALDRIGREDWESRITSWSALLEQPGSILQREEQILLRLIVEIRRVAASPQPPAPQLANNGQILQLLREGRHSGFEEAVEYTKQHGYQLEMVEAVRAYHETLHGTVTDQARRQHVGWWLWLEDTTPIKADECWSSIVRADLRNFTGDRKRAWLELIGNMTFAVVTKPPAKWVKPAESALSKIDPQDFRDQIRRWMEPFKSDQPLRLSTPGRDVLRCLIWDCGLFGPDPRLGEALSWISRAKWKNKESRDRLSKIEGPLNEILSASHPERVMKIERPAPKPADPQAAMNKVMAQMLRSMPMGDRIEVHPDHILVRGERDQYRIGMDGVITRRSGVKARVNLDAMPPYLTQMLQPAIDAMDLAQGMFQPNQMRLFSLAYILANDTQWENAIE
jgi:hypothetical protein